MAKIDLIRTGVPGLDTALGGGLPELSFNVIGGTPGAGKTTLAHQILFANATVERPAIYFTVVGEPPVKMLRYQQQFAYFDTEKVDRVIHFRNLAQEALAGDLDAVFERIVEAVEEIEPAFVVVDSFRSISRITEMEGELGSRGFQGFVQRLSSQMTRWEATTFLLGEFDEGESVQNPIFTVADGVIWLRHIQEHDSRVRTLEVTKMRGRAELPGQHIYRITEQGLRIFPRLLAPLAPLEGAAEKGARVSIGVEGLDELMNGGIPAGDAVVVAGPSGSGKSLLSMQFIGAGLENGESGVVAIFEESASRYLDRARVLGVGFEEAEEEGRLRLLQSDRLDLAVDEAFEGIRDAVEELGASRVVIDSLSGLQVAAKGAQTARLRQAMARLIQTLTEAGVTVLMTAEFSQQANTLRFTPHETSFLADDMILQRYVEISGELETVTAVVKMRRSSHRRTFHRYVITAGGLVIGEALTGFHGILTAAPEMRDAATRTEGEWEAIGEGGSTPGDEPEDGA